MTLYKLVSQSEPGLTSVMDLLMVRFFGKEEVGIAGATINKRAEPLITKFFIERGDRIRTELSALFDELMDPAKVAEKAEIISYADLLKLSVIIDTLFPARIFGADNVNKEVHDDSSEVLYALKAVYMEAYINQCIEQGNALFDGIAREKAPRIITMDKDKTEGGIITLD